MASSLTQLSACVTRILSLTGFPKELKTRDIQSAFVEWENVSGGFKIKWIDDTSLLIVFQDATVAKRAYLHALAFPPAVLSKQAPEAPTFIRPYDGPDAQTVIQTVNSRHIQSASKSIRLSISHNGRPSSAISPSHSYSNPVRNNGSVPPGPSIQNTAQIPSRQSPTLPNLPSHPTLNSLISSTLGSPNTDDVPPSDPAILAIGGPAIDSLESIGTPPRIGDPGKRMLGAALGVRHPGLGPRAIDIRPSPSNGQLPVSISAE